MKTILVLILAASLSMLGLGVANTHGRDLPKGCTPSKIAKPGDAYSYQGKVDPQIIFNEWNEILELRRGDIILMQRVFKNPDPDSDILAAALLIQTGSTFLYSYLCQGRVHIFMYDFESGCYLEEKINEAQIWELKEILLKAAFGGEARGT